MGWTVRQNLGISRGHPTPRRDLVRQSCPGCDGPVPCDLFSTDASTVMHGFENEEKILRCGEMRYVVADLHSESHSSAAMCARRLAAWLQGVQLKIEVG